MSSGLIETPNSLIDASPVSRLQLLVVMLCFMTVAVDGFDTAVMGYLAPAIAGEWALEPSNIAAVFAAGLVGSICGAVVFGPVCDVIGRTRTLIVATLVFGILTAATALAQSLGHLGSGPINRIPISAAMFAYERVRT